MIFFKFCIAKNNTICPCKIHGGLQVFQSIQNKHSATATWKINLPGFSEIFEEKILGDALFAFISIKMDVLRFNLSYALCHHF